MLPQREGDRDGSGGCLSLPLVRDQGPLGKPRIEEGMNRLTESRIRKAAAMALAAVGFCANADGVIGNPLGPTLPDLNRECFEDLSKPSEPDTYKHWSAERKDYHERYSFEHTAGLGWKDTSPGYADGYRKNEWHYEPKGNVFAYSHNYEYDYSNYCVSAPEPQTWALMLIGLLGLAALRRSKERFAAELAPHKSA